MWLPPVVFTNAARAKIGTVVRPNQEVEIRPSGRVIYRARYEMTAVCKMHFDLYPFDTQLCGLNMMSFGYKSTVLSLNWSTAKLMVESYDQYTQPDVTSNDTHHEAYVNPTIDFVQFELKEIKGNPGTNKSQMGTDVSLLEFRFKLKRRFMFAAIYMFLPSVFLTICSYMTLWLDPSALMPRIAMNVTTLLSLQTLSGTISRSLPPVSYIKALDVWLMGTNTIVLCILVEFIIVNYVFRTKYTVAWRFLCQSKVTTLDETSKEATAGSPALSIFIDKCARILFALIYLVFAASFWAIYWGAEPTDANLWN